MVMSMWHRNGGGRENIQGHKSFSFKCSAERKSCRGRMCIWVDRNNIVIAKRRTKECTARNHNLLFDNLESIREGDHYVQSPVFRRRIGKYFIFMFFNNKID